MDNDRKARIVGLIQINICLFVCLFVCWLVGFYFDIASKKYKT